MSKKTGQQLVLYQQPDGSFQTRKPRNNNRNDRQRGGLAGAIDAAVDGGARTLKGFWTVVFWVFVVGSLFGMFFLSSCQAQFAPARQNTDQGRRVLPREAAPRGTALAQNGAGSNATEQELSVPAPAPAPMQGAAPWQGGTAPGNDWRMHYPPPPPQRPACKWIRVGVRANVYYISVHMISDVGSMDADYGLYHCVRRLYRNEPNTRVRVYVDSSWVAAANLGYNPDPNDPYRQSGFVMLSVPVSGTVDVRIYNWDQSSYGFQVADGRIQD